MAQIAIETACGSISNMNVGEFVDSLIYTNYVHNRMRAPEIIPERWEKVYGLDARAMEARYQQSLSVGIAQ